MVAIAFTNLSKLESRIYPQFRSFLGLTRFIEVVPADVENALVWLSPENCQILCPFDSLWSKNLAQDIVRELRQS